VGLGKQPRISRWDFATSPAHVRQLSAIWDLLKSALLRCQVSLLAGQWELATGVNL
jgi:hypothetical protein